MQREIVWHNKEITQLQIRTEADRVKIKLLWNEKAHNCSHLSQ